MIIQYIKKHLLDILLCRNDRLSTFLKKSKKNYFKKSYKIV